MIASSQAQSDEGHLSAVSNEATPLLDKGCAEGKPHVHAYAATPKGVPVGIEVDETEVNHG